MCFDLPNADLLLNALICIAVGWFAVTAFFAAEAERGARRRGDRDEFLYRDDEP